MVVINMRNWRKRQKDSISVLINYGKNRLGIGELDKEPYFSLIFLQPWPALFLIGAAHKAGYRLF